MIEAMTMPSADAQANYNKYIGMTGQPGSVGVYGWGGAFCYYGLIIMTLIRGFSALFRRSPLQRRASAIQR